MTPVPNSEVAPVAPSQEKFGAVPTGTPNSVTLCVDASDVGVSLRDAVATILPWRSCNWSTGAPQFVLVAAIAPSMPGLSRVHFPSPASLHSPASSQVHVSVLP